MAVIRWREQAALHVARQILAGAGQLTASSMFWQLRRLSMYFMPNVGLRAREFGTRCSGHPRTIAFRIFRLQRFPYPVTPLARTINYRAYA
jgi:hypothetical protein